MAKKSKKSKVILVPDILYSTLYLMRFDNNNCQATCITDNLNQDYEALRYDTGLQHLIVMPESSSPPSNMLKI